MSKKIKYFMLCSITLNIFLLGLMAGHMTQRFGPKPPQRHHSEMNDFLAKSSLSEAKRESIAKAFQKIISSPRERGGVRQRGKPELSALTAEIFDEQAFRAQIEKKQQHMAKRKQYMTDAIVELASQLNQEERKELAKLLHKKRPKGEGRRR